MCESVEAGLVVVMGGRYKGGEFRDLLPALQARGATVVAIGEAAPLIAEAVGDVVPVRRASTMDDAVKAAADLAQPGDAVLLSPACSSFDMFRDYKHRGDEFVRAVRAMEEASS